MNNKTITEFVEELWRRQADFTLLDLHNFLDNTQPHSITVKYPELSRGQANKDGNQEPITIEVGMYELF